MEKNRQWIKTIWDDLPGNLLVGRYKILQQLGRGNGRRIFLAYDLQTQQQVAIKLLLLGQDFDWQALKLFDREAKILQSLDHPAIPRYLNFFELDSACDRILKSPGSLQEVVLTDTSQVSEASPTLRVLPTIASSRKGFALVQSYVAEQSLEVQLKAGRTFSETEVKQLARSLLEILIYLHGLTPPAIHRDIKPSNILLSNRSGHRSGQIYLVDFGSVKVLTARKGGTLTVVGTYGYIPPEQFGGRAVPASDLFSLGKTLIYLMTGVHPAGSLQQDCRNRLKGTVMMDPAFADWLLWLTEPALEQRPESAIAALKRLENLPQKTTTCFLLRQPPGSDIQLHKTAQSLIVCLPPKGIGPGLIGAISIFPSAAMWLVHAIHQSFTNTALNTILYFALSLLGFLLLLLAGIGLLVWLLSSLFKHRQLHIDSQYLSCSYRYLGLRWQAISPIRRQEISQLRLRQYFPGSAYLLEIQTRTKSFSLNIDRLSHAELDWLIQELGHFLGVTITKSSYSP